MKRYIGILLAFCLLVGGAHVEAALSEIPVAREVDQGSPEFELNTDIQEKYQAAARLFSESRGKTTQTNVITLETLPNGVHVHVGWYPDGSIGTAMDGSEQGKQVVFCNNQVVAISYDIDVRSDHFIHRYTWGKVYSYVNRQVVVCD